MEQLYSFIWCLKCYSVDFFLLLLFLFDVIGALVFFFILYKAHSQYLHLVRTFWRCSSSCNCCWLEHTAYALQYSVLITLYFADMAWWPSHCKYWSVWVGFLYTVVTKLPSDYGMTSVSKKDMEPSALVFSAVNWMPSSKELMCCRNLSLCTALMTTKASSTNLIHRLGGVVLFWGLWLQSLPCISWPLLGLLVIPLLHPLFGLCKAWRPYWWAQLNVREFIFVRFTQVKLMINAPWYQTGMTTLQIWFSDFQVYLLTLLIDPTHMWVYQYHYIVFTK